VNHRRILIWAIDTADFKAMLPAIKTLFNNSDQILLSFAYEKKFVSLHKLVGSTKTIEIADFGDDEESLDLQKYFCSVGDITKVLFNDFSAEEINVRLKQLNRWEKSYTTDDTRFLDLMVVSRNYLNENNLPQESHVGMLCDVKCSLLVLDPLQYVFNKLIINYNGTDASFNAIQKFSYIFEAQYQDANVHLAMHINDNALDAENCVYSYLRTHKKNIAIHRFFEDEYNYSLEQLLSDEHGAMLISGSERCNTIHQFIDFAKKSNDHCSLFIA